MQTIFTDLIGNISLSAGVVRMDMLRIISIDQETKQPHVEVTGHIAMPLEGFLRSLGNQEKVRDELISKGILTKSPISNDSK